MPPASVAHFKHRVPSGTSPTNEQLPPSKRPRESPSGVVGERAVMERAPPYDEKKCALGSVAPPDEKKLVVRGKSPTDAENTNAPGRGNYDISDPETLDCSICNNPLFLPVYQCKNGHTACPKCWSTFEKAKMCCHSCNEKTWNIRCLVVEKILEHLSVRCNNSVYGCNEFLKFLKKKEHEEFCRHRPFKCPLGNCGYEGPKPVLLQHFDKMHQMQAVQVDRASRKAIFTMDCTEKYKLLQSEQEFYIVYHEAMAGSVGDIFYCASLGPYKRSYVLIVELRSESRFHVLRTAVPEIKVLENWKLRRDYLIVPNGVQVNPRSDCQFNLDLELYGGTAQVPVRSA